MGYTRTDYYETIIQRQIRSGRASNKTEVIHQALALLDAAFETFDRLAQFPLLGPRARFRNPALKETRFFVLPPPFNHWLVFYQPCKQHVEIKRVLYGNANWRQQPERFF